MREFEGIAKDWKKEQVRIYLVVISIEVVKIKNGGIIII